MKLEVFVCPFCKAEREKLVGPEDGGLVPPALCPACKAQMVRRKVRPIPEHISWSWRKAGS